MAHLQRLQRAAEEPDANDSALNAYAWELLVIEPADLRDPAAALPIAQEAVDIGGNSPANLHTLARAWFDNGEVAQALELQEQVVSLLPLGESELRQDSEATST